MSNEAASPALSLRRCEAVQSGIPVPAQANFHRNGDLASGYLFTDPVEETAGCKLLASQ
jgi:hypothetical protein